MGYLREFRDGHRSRTQRVSGWLTRRVRGPSTGGRWEWAIVRQLTARLGFPPATVWRFTLRDLAEQVEGLKWRERQAWERTAWQTAILLRKFGDHFTPQQLLGDVVTDPEAALEAIVEGDTAESRLARLDAILAAQPRRERPL